MKRETFLTRTLQEKTFHHAALRHYMMMYRTYEHITYEHTLEQALIHYIGETERLQKELIETHQKTVVPEVLVAAEIENLSKRDKSLLSSLQIQLKMVEQKYNQLLDQFNAKTVQADVTDKENRMMEQVLKKMKYDIKTLIGRDAREFDESER